MTTTTSEYTLGGGLTAQQSDQEVRERLANLSYRASSWIGPLGELEDVRKAVYSDRVLPGRSPEQSRALVDHVINWVNGYDRSRNREAARSIVKFGLFTILGLTLLLGAAWSFSTLPSLLP